MSARKLFALDLVDDAALIAAYEARHAAGAVWPEIVRDIGGRGILDMEIWRIDDRLIMVAEVAADYPRAPDPALAGTVARWEAQMDAYQKPIRTDGPKWAEMTRIFALAEQCG
jgi:L-rhamnose mutarotase